MLSVLLKDFLYFACVAFLAWATYRIARRCGSRAAIGLVLSFAVGAVLPVWWPYISNPLPEDEAMIAHLRTHRTDIEELVRRYRHYQPLPTVMPAPFGIVPPK
jgi:hypothetical protein